MTTIAPVLKQTVSQIHFCVDDVETTEKRLPVRNAISQLETYFEQQLLAFSHDEAFQIVQDNSIPAWHSCPLSFHPLAHTVHLAFSEHRPLVLTPDILWITLAQGFAQHVNNHAETLRSHFVRYEGKQTLVVETPQIPTHPQQWGEAIQQWTLHIRDHVGADLYRLLECNFTTTTPITHIASHVVMMDAFQKYFDYKAYCICGIPDITLEGTIEDWQSIYDRVQSMTQYELGWWTSRVLPICQEFIKTVSGQPSLEFWQGIYKPKEVYGGELITGWLADLFPYLKNSVTKAPSVRNPILDIDRTKLTVNNGIPPHSIPLGLSEVPIKLKTRDGQRYSLGLIAGFIGVYQTEDGKLQPEVGWAVREQQNDRFADLLDKIQQEHITQAPINWRELEYRLEKIPKELIQLLDRFDGATLYAESGHSWKIAEYSCSKRYETSRQQVWAYGLGPWTYGAATHLIDLADGRCIAHVDNRIILGKPTRYLDVFHDERYEFKYGDFVVIAESIPQLFERIFAAEGLYYFDDPGFVPQ